MVLASRSELINDIRRAPDDVPSRSESIKEVHITQNVELILMGIT